MNITKRIYNEVFGVALAAEDAPMTEKIQWENDARNEIAKAEVITTAVGLTILPRIDPYYGRA